MSTQSVGIPLEGFAEFSRTVAAEGAVLLKNDQQVLPLAESDNIAVFGRTQVNYYRSGTGSGGSVHVTYTTNLLGGLRSKRTLRSTKIWQQYMRSGLSKIHLIMVAAFGLQSHGTRRKCFIRRIGS